MVSHGFLQDLFDSDPAGQVFADVVDPKADKADLRLDWTAKKVHL